MNCIWITIDSFRQDHVHCYFPQGATDPSGEGIRVQTPNIDRLAAEGVLFERMRAEALPTICARRSMFTGRRLFPWPDEPFYKGIYVRTPGWRPLPQEDVTVAEHLSEQGYVTAMVADVYHMMKPSMNFHRGFQNFQWVRGQEFDRWQSQPLPEGYLERFLKPGTVLKEGQKEVFGQCLKNQMVREGDEDFQAARTFRQAIAWAQEQGPLRYVRASILRHNRRETGFIPGTAIHCIDALREIGGEIVDDQVQMHEGDPPWYHIVFRFESGAIGSLDVLTTDGSVEERYELFGEGYRVDARVGPSPEPDRERAGRCVGGDAAVL